MHDTLLKQVQLRYDGTMFDALIGEGILNSSALSLFPLPFIALALWSLVWKGFSTWHAARQGSKTWFIALLLINTAGILDILYLFVFSKMQIESDEQQQTQ